MPKLSKSEFASLVSSMPDASEDEILAEAARRDAEPAVAAAPPEGRFKKFMRVATTPLTDAPSRAAKVVADSIDQPTLEGGRLGAQLKGFAAGAVQGVGDLVSSLTSPVDLALTAASLGGAGAAKLGLKGVSQGARALEVGLQAPLVAQGGLNAVEGAREGDFGKVGAGALQAGMGAVGMKMSAKAPHVKPVVEKAPVVTAPVEPRLNVEAQLPSASTSPKPALPEAEIAAHPSPQAYTPEDAAVNIAELHNANEGSTFNLHKGSLSGTKAYAVSAHQGREQIVKGGQLTPEVVSQYLAKNQDLLSDPKNSVGSWFNKEDGNTYLDISHTTDNLDDALNVGRANKQLAVFDLENFKEIQVPETVKEAGRGLSSTAMSIAGPAAALAVPEDEDSNWDDYARIGLTLSAAGPLMLGKVLSTSPKPGRVFKGPDGFKALHPETGRVVKIGLGSSPDNLRPAMTTSGIPPEWEQKLARVGLKNGGAPVSKPVEQLTTISKDGSLRFNKEVELRLRTLYDYGNHAFKDSGDAEWVNNGIMDDLLKFLPVKDPAVASHRLFGATSPAQEVPGNLLDTLRVALRAKLQQSKGNLDLGKESVQENLMRGIGNRPSKSGNVQRALTGEPLQSYAAPDPMPAGKTEDLAKGMAGKLDAIPFDMWWARAVGLDHDAQPLNGLSYKLFYDAGADIAKKVGSEPFPFMAKVWAAMKQLHREGGGIAPNKLAGDIGLGQKDLFDGSTTPGGKTGQKMLKQIMTGGTELMAPTGVSKRATKMQGEADEARHLLDVANKAGFKGLRVMREGKQENILKKQTYAEMVSNRPEGKSFKQAGADSTKVAMERLKDKKAVTAESAQALAKHIVAQWKKGTPEQPILPLKGDPKLMDARIKELLTPEQYQKDLYKKALKDAILGTKASAEPKLF